MSNKIFYSSPRARFFDTNGNPLSNGRVSFYEAGTTTLKPIYTDITQTTPAPNPALLDSEGYVRDQGIWLGGGRYKFKLDEAIVANPDVNENADFAELWTMDNIEGASVLNSGELSTIVVATIADLRALTAGEYSLVYVAGYWTENDGGGGWFNYDPNDIEAHNGGTVIAPSDNPTTGRYLRNLENWEVSVQYFGATSSAFDLFGNVVGSYCQNALTWCLANDRTLVFPADIYTFGSSQTFQGDLTINIKENAVFNTSATPITMTFRPTILAVDGKSNHRGDDVTLVLNPITPTTFRPEHWGAKGTQATDFEAFLGLDGNYGNSRIELTGDYVVTRPQGSSITEFSTQNMHIVKGSTITTDLFFNIGSYTFDDGLQTCFLFDADLIQSLVDPVLYLNHFQNFTSLSDTNFALMADALTNLGARHGSFKLLTGGTYNVNGITAIPSYSMDLFIKVGNKVNAVTDSELPRLTNGFNDFAILDSSGADIKFSNDVHAVTWWGASSNSSSVDNIAGLTKAFDSASKDFDNAGIIQGNNEGLDLGAGNLNFVDSFVKVENLIIKNASSFGFSSSNVEIYNSTIPNFSTTSGTKYSLESCTLGGSVFIASDVIEVSRCRFSLGSASLSVTLNANEELYYEGNRSTSGRFNFTTGSSTNVISNNRFNGLVRSGAGTETQDLITINGGSNSTINGNSFYCSDSSSTQQITKVIAFGGLANIVNSLSCCSNSFVVNHSGDSTSSGSSWRPINADGYANTGHIASVENNSFSEGFVQIRETTSTQAFINIASTSAFIRGEGIFPYNGAPTYLTLLARVNSVTFINYSQSAGLGNCTISGSYDLATLGDDIYLKVSWKKPTS